MNLKKSIKPWLRNASLYVADQGLNLVTAVIATIDGLGGRRRGRFHGTEAPHRAVLAH